MEDQTETRIRLRAYEIWKENGCPFGMEEAHWQQAQVELAALDAYGLEPKKVQDMQEAHARSKSPKVRGKRGKQASVKP